MEVGGDGSEPGWGWVEMDINSVETGGDTTNVPMQASNSQCLRCRWCC